MELLCDLEVEIDTQHSFFVNKKVLALFSGKLRKNLEKAPETGRFKVIYRDFPRGEDGFRLFLSFCYNNGDIEITPRNIGCLYCVARYMEMETSIRGLPNLIDQTTNFLTNVSLWNLSEIAYVLMESEYLLPLHISSELHEKCSNSVVAKIISATDCGSYSSSPDSSLFRFSCDTMSTSSIRSHGNRAWWFDDLLVLNLKTIKKIIRKMVSRKFDDGIISRFLFYYLKSKLSSFKSSEKAKIAETIVDLIFTLENPIMPIKGQFDILRMVSGLSINKSCITRLERVIGSRLEKSTLNNLLLPSPGESNVLYDVDLVMRFIKFFLDTECPPFSSRLKAVGRLIDMYLIEIAPDSNLGPLKFYKIIASLPDASRDSFDGIYRAIDLYFQLHSGLSEEEMMKICSTLNYEKLSLNICRDLAKNPKFPPRAVLQAILYQQSKLKNLLQANDKLRSFEDSLFLSSGTSDCREKIKNRFEHTVLDAETPGLSINREKLRINMLGLQSRIMELEKVFQKIQTQMEKIKKSKGSYLGYRKSLPKFCS